MSLKDFRHVKDPILFIFQYIAGLFYIVYCVFQTTVTIFFPPDMKDVSGEIVLITGAGSGLGRAMAIDFVKAGSKVVCADIQTEANEETAAILNEMAPNSGRAYTCDIGQATSVKELADKVYAEFGKVDILVNNAGILPQFGLLEANISDEHIQRLFNINVTGHFRMVRAFLPDMIKRNKGHVVAISSMSSMTGVANACGYASSKWAVSGFMESLRLELLQNPLNEVQTTLVLPYFINTHEEYAKYIHSRLPILETNYCSRKIIRNVRRNIPVFSIPEELRILSNLTRVLPLAVQDYFTTKVFYVNWQTPKTEERSKNKSFQILTSSKVEQ